jgi:hypothetical protein
MRGSTSAADAPTFGDGRIRNTMGAAFRGSAMEASAAPAEAAGDPLARRRALARFSEGRAKCTSIPDGQALAIALGTMRLPG